MLTSKDQVDERSLAEEKRLIAKILNLRDIEEALVFPKFFQIETVRVCNSRCPFCAVDLWDKSVPLMSDTLFDKIVDEIGQYADWIDVVDVQRAGEPLMDKKIADRIRKLKQTGLKRVCLSTNGSLLTEEKASAILTAGLDEVWVSIDSIDKATYEQLRVGLHFETVMRNTEALFRVRDRVKPQAVIRIRGVSFYNMEKQDDRDSLGRYEDYWMQFTKPWDRVYMKSAKNWGNQKAWGDKLRPGAWLYSPCIIPWSTMHITTRGIVGLCPEDFDGNASLGDVNTQTIAEVWRNEGLKRIRELHASGNRNEISFCQGCRTFDDGSLENWRQKWAEG